MHILYTFACQGLNKLYTMFHGAILNRPRIARFTKLLYQPVGHLRTTLFAEFLHFGDIVNRKNARNQCLFYPGSLGFIAKSQEGVCREEKLSDGAMRALIQLVFEPLQIVVGAG